MRRDPATLFLALLIPVVQLLIFGVAIDTEVKDLPTVVVDRARTRVSRELTRALEATGTFRMVGEVPDRDTALSRMRSGHARAALLFPDDFAERLLAGEPPSVQVLIDGSDGNAASQAQAAALGLAVDWTRRHGGGTGPTDSTCSCNRSRLVTSNRRVGHPATTAPSWAAAGGCGRSAAGSRPTGS